MSVTNKDIATLIIDFLKKSVAEKQIGEDYLESIDVAIDCIADAYEVDKDSDSKLIKEKFNGNGLVALLSNPSAVQDAPIPVTIEKESKQEDPALKEKAEALKREGNQAMAAKSFDVAIEKYTQAIELSPSNVIYLSNRAAAYSSTRDHESAVADSKKAIELDPSYAKAYSRLGLAKYALGDAKGAMEAYKQGIDIEGDKKSEAMAKGYETARRRVQEELEKNLGSDALEKAPETPASASAGSSAGAGGLPDFSSFLKPDGSMPSFSDMMSNPNLMSAAQQMMSNPQAMQNLLSNPAIAQMAQNFGLGGGNGASGSGGAPDLSNIMNNPMFKDLANQFGGAGNGGN